MEVKKTKIIIKKRRKETKKTNLLPDVNKYLLNFLIKVNNGRMRVQPP